MSDPIRITIFNEFVHERQREDVTAVYPRGIHAAIADGLRERLASRAEIRTATLDQPEHGLDQATVDSTDVLFWWGHLAHDEVDGAVVDRLQAAVLAGMGLVVLHSGHAAQIFTRLMGTGCMLRWRESGERERLWVVDPSHPIVAGIEGEYFELAQTEMYGEFFDIPAPDELVLISWFAGGEVFRSGCTFRRGAGRIFYFRPGHETYPIFFDSNVRRVLANAAEWAAPKGSTYYGAARNTRPIE